MRPMPNLRIAAPVLALVAVVANLAAACSPGGPRPTGTAQPDPSTCGALESATASTPPKGGCGAEGFTEGALRLRLMDGLGPRWYCDPDEYPVSQGSEQERAIERFAEMQVEGDLFGAASRKLGIDPAGPFSDAQKLAVYRLWKVGLSIHMNPIGNDRFRFEYLAQPAAGAAQGLQTAGLIDSRGAVTIEQQGPAGEPMCPICLSIGTLIDTPEGAVPVESLRIGDPIWTLDTAGRRVAGTVIALGSTAAPRDHEVVRLILADGRQVAASPGHPLADGRLIGDLQAGDVVDRSLVEEVERVAYGGADTYDLVASGETGLYFARGIPLASTLR